MENVAVATNACCCYLSNVIFLYIYIVKYLTLFVATDAVVVIQVLASAAMKDRLYPTNI